jgi:hypothetical protein
MTPNGITGLERVKYMSRNLIKYEQTPKVTLKHQSNHSVRSDNEEQNKIPWLLYWRLQHFRLPSFMPPKLILLARRDYKTSLVQYKHVAFNNKGTACTGTNFRICVRECRTASCKSECIRKDLRPRKSMKDLCGSSRLKCKFWTGTQIARFSAHFSHSPENIKIKIFYMGADKSLVRLGRK